jgi:penicillin amidase
MALAAVVALAAVGWWWTRSVIPPLDGRIPVLGLHAAVEVRFDAFAIPHIYAASEEDAWEAVGYLQARDRMWQMELYRRAAAGRLSELLGEQTIAIDQRFLTLGLRAAAETEWQTLLARGGTARTALERHSLGVTAAMAVGRLKRPLEFQLLGVRPEPWTPVDSLAIGKLFAWRLGENHNAEALRYALLDVRGPDIHELFPDPPEWAPVILGPQARAQGRGLTARGVTHGSGLKAQGSSRHFSAPVETRRLTSADPAGLGWLLSDTPAMSNSWVISGSRTATGRPLLANDPHLEIEMPSAWWEVHVVAGGLAVSGVTIPGIPFIPSVTTSESPGG